MTLPGVLQRLSETSHEQLSAGLHGETPGLSLTEDASTMHGAHQDITLCSRCIHLNFKLTVIQLSVILKRINSGC